MTLKTRKGRRTDRETKNLCIFPQTSYDGHRLWCTQTLIQHYPACLYHISNLLPFHSGRHLQYFLDPILKSVQNSLSKESVQIMVQKPRLTDRQTDRQPIHGVQIFSRHRPSQMELQPGGVKRERKTNTNMNGYLQVIF